MSPIPKFLYYKSPSNGKWYFKFIGRNGRPVIESHGYEHRANMILAISTIKECAAGALVEEDTIIPKSRLAVGRPRKIG